MLAAAAGASAEDGIWLDVIRKMDEVYNDLLQYEVALEEKNADAGGYAAVHLLGADLDVRPADRLQPGRRDRKRQCRPWLRLLGVDAESLHGRTVFDLFADEESRQRAGRLFGRSRRPRRRGLARCCSRRPTAARFRCRSTARRVTTASAR
jgi:two-component system sensor histidine kinase HupT/HoxJ